MTYYYLWDTKRGGPIPGHAHYTSRVVASEARMGIARQRAGWNAGEPTEAQRKAFLARNDEIEIRS